MKLPSSLTPAMVRHLNQVYFGRTWNATDDHGRANFIAYKAASVIQMSSVSVNGAVVGLPTTDAVYAVYTAPASRFGRFVKLPENTWTLDTVFLNNQSVSIIAYDNTGKMLPTGTVYFYLDPIYQKVIIAVSSVYTKACCGLTYPTLYLSVYRDTSRNTPIVNQIFTISAAPGSTSTPTLVTAAINTAVTSCPLGTVIYVNGFAYDHAHVPQLVVGNVVQITSDPDVVGYCDVTVDDNQTGYYSNLYQEYREVLHVQKSINPNNIIITNDTVDVVIFDSLTNRGLYGLRIDPHAVESITHNDFSMSRSVLDAFATSLGASSIYVRVYVRFPTRSIILTDDANRMIDLYGLTDSKIQNQLVGLSSTQIAEWEASHLEQSSFLTLLYAFKEFDSSVIIDTFVEAMGYYDVGGVLGQSARTFRYEGAQVEVMKPTRLYGYPCNAICYSNGRKLPSSTVIIQDKTSCSFLLSVSSSSYVAIGSTIDMYIIEAADRSPIEYPCSSSVPSVTVANGDYDLYVTYTYPTNQPVWGKSVTKGYRLLGTTSTDFTTTMNSNGTVTFTPNALYQGHTIYLVPKYGMFTAQYALDDYITEQKPILIDLLTTTSTSNTITMFGYTTMEAYVNGYKLVEGVDYVVTKPQGQYYDTLQSLFMLCNSDYLNLTGTGNSLEIIYHGDTIISSDVGYALGNKLYRQTEPMIWSRPTGRVYVHGLLVDDITQIANVLTSGSTTFTDGAIYNLEWCLPYGAQKLLSDQSAASQNDLIRRIDAVIGTVVPTYPSTVLIDHLYALYSPFLAQVTYDVANSTFTIVNDPKDDSFLRQFLPYAILQNADPIIDVSNPYINRQFVTLAAHYVNMTVSDPIQMVLLQRLITLTLTPSQLAINEVLI